MATVNPLLGTIIVVRHRSIREKSLGQELATVSALRGWEPNRSDSTSAAQNMQMRTGLQGQLLSIHKFRKEAIPSCRQRNDGRKKQGWHPNLEWRSSNKCPRAALLFLETTKWSNRYLCGPALLRNSLGQRRRPLCQVDMVVSCGWRAQAASASGEGHLTRSSSRDGKFRKQGESMTSFCIRHREEYKKVCRALTRMMRSQKSELWKEQGWEIVLQAEHLERVLQ